ncbi:MAG: hypothetical protein OXE94_14645 [Aestuariivita sp.]|nr:hypothetical protein [Aestuariivita sp.]MCY4203098.1 hypothetical protein [Aestuariivita sp.]MCY4287156.1 hypothetical protein [Aestuariivita sp.]MCY4347577.1 hypothetical protein [Aestuariivita sp.]
MLNPIGLLDQDDWTTAEVTDRAAYTITALFYSSQAEIFDGDARQLTSTATAVALAVLDQVTKDAPAARRAEKTVRNKLLSH